MIASKLENKPYRVYADTLDGATLSQFFSALAEPYSVRGALMADAHLGYSLPIGGVIATHGMIVPAWVGYDIGCGMYAVPTSFESEDVFEKAEDIYKSILEFVPVGLNHRATPLGHMDTGLLSAEGLKIYDDKRGCNQIGTLGSGNHFIEIGHDEDMRVWVVIHSGSRGVGHGLATHHMKVASGDGKAREGHYPLRVDSPEGQAYIGDMKFAESFALMNRWWISDMVAFAMNKHCRGALVNRHAINRNHNHAEEKDGLWIHRKGATHAELGMMGVIPGNMRHGSFIVRGKGCVDSLYSSSHGAGRAMSRKEAKQTIDLEKFKLQMKSVVSRADETTLDEAPDAYKNIHDVMRAQSDLVEVVAHVAPIINVKG